MVFSQGAVGTRGYYGVLPSDRNVPYIHGVYNIVLARVGDSGLVVTPLMQYGIYPVRSIATLGPWDTCILTATLPSHTLPYCPLPSPYSPSLPGTVPLLGGGILAGSRYCIGRVR